MRSSTGKKFIAAIALVALIGLVLYVRPQFRVTVERNFVKLDTSLYDAIAAGESERVKQMIELDPEVVRTYRYNGSSALHLATTRRRTDLMLLLLQKGADVNAEIERETGGKDTTSLHIAAEYNDAKSIAILLQHGADPSLRDKYGRTPLEIAIGFRNQAAIEALTPKEQ